MTKETRLKSLGGHRDKVDRTGADVWVVTIDNIQKCTLKKVYQNGYCLVQIGDKSKKYRTTRVYLNELMAQLRFTRDTDKYFQPISEKFKPSLNIQRIISIRRNISNIEPAWFI